MTPPTAAATVAPVHGGLDRPVHRITSCDQRTLSAWREMRSIEVEATDRATLYRIADGTLSPLLGPMGEDDTRSVLERGAIERGGKLWAWTIPIVQPVTDEEAAGCAVGAAVALRFEGEVFGRLVVDSVFDWDPRELVAKIYGTDRLDHPGARLWMEDERRKLVSGKIELFPLEDDRSFARRVLPPARTRELIEERGWEQSIAFQTRNPLHRAHEYALVHGAEKLLAENGRKTGVVLNPLVGQLKGDDVPAATRMATYEALVDGRLLGRGDMDEELWKRHGQDMNDQLELVGLDMRMYYGGPREAVMHAIYRQNLGFTHFIIGRKHADAPFDDKTPIWGDFDAQEIFRNLGGELAIRTVDVGFAAYFEELGRVGLIEDNAGKTMVNISGTRMRELLSAGEMPDERVMRPSTAKILADYYQDTAR